MNAITHATSAKDLSRPDVDTMDLDVADEHHLQHRLEQDCLTEIDRHRRMDEWTSSYQNIYARTALDCQRKLANAGLGDINPMRFLQYTRPGNFDMLRVTAFENLVDSKIFEHGSLLRYFLFSLSTDPSPWVRTSLQRLLGKAFAARAIGDVSTPEQEPQDDLIIEQDSTVETRQTELARKQSLDSAMEALRGELEKNEVLKTNLWSATTFRHVSLNELQTLLEYCRILYMPVNEMKITFKLPRYLRVQYLGNVSGPRCFRRHNLGTEFKQGRLKFTPTEKIRTRPAPKLIRPPTAAYDLKPPTNRSSTPTGLKLSLKNPNVAPKSELVRHEASEIRKPSLKLKLKLGSSNGIERPQQ